MPVRGGRPPLGAADAPAVAARGPGARRRRGLLPRAPRPLAGLRGLRDRSGHLGAARARPRAPGVSLSRVRAPATAGDDRGRLHRGERPLEADRGLPAAGLHGVPEPGGVRRRRDHDRDAGRRLDRRPPRRDRGDPALLLPRGRGPGAGRPHRLRIALLDVDGARRDRAAARRADLGAPPRRPLRARARPPHDPRPLAADALGVRADPAAARRARPRLLHAHDRGGDRDDPDHGRAGRRDRPRRRRDPARQLRHRRASSCSGASGSSAGASASGSTAGCCGG